MSRSITSTSDTQAEIEIALGLEPGSSEDSPEEASALAENTTSEAAPVEEKKPEIVAESEPAKESQVTEEGSPEAETTEEKKPKGGFQKRIDKLTKKTHELETELAEAKRLAAEAAVKHEQAVESKPEVKKQPVDTDFDSVADWIEALTEWKIEQKEMKKAEQAKADAEATAAANQARRIEQEQLSEKQKVDSYVERAAEFAEENEDFATVVNKIPSDKLTRETQIAIMESESGPELAYWLAKHPEDLDLLANTAKISEKRAAMVLGKIEDRLFASKQKPAETAKPVLATPPPVPEVKKPQASKAPEPITPVGGYSATAINKKLTDEMPFKEYQALKKQLGIR